MKAIVISILVGISSFANAGVDSDVSHLQKSVVCAPGKEVRDQIIVDSKEDVIFQGMLHSQQSAVTMTFNKNTKTWSIILYDKTNACLIAYGNKGNVIPMGGIQLLHLTK